jgi:catalase
MAVVDPDLTAAAASVSPSPPSKDPEAHKTIDSIQSVYGTHPGFRVAHARGTVCTGEFVPTETGRAVGSAFHMQEPVDVTVRFSNASGDPGVPDFLGDARGMATRFRPKDAQSAEAPSTDIVAVTLPCFFVRGVKSFLELNETQRRNDPGKLPRQRPIKVVRFWIRHPEARTALKAAISQPRVPSYANCRFNALHAFEWTGEDGAVNYVRYSWVPEEGERSLSRRQARGLPRDYLQQELYDRLGRTPVRPIKFKLLLQLASLHEIDGGMVCDPTTVWPRSLEHVDAGQLVLTGLEEGAGEGEQQLVFDPTNLTDGIDLPVVSGQRDQILEFRPRAYAISARMRTGSDS